MRTLLLIIIATTFSITTQAALPPATLVGYVVMANNDTVKCKIKGGRFLNPFYGVTIINEQGEEQSFRIKDKKIIAFGFIENIRRYHYFYIEAGDKFEHGFYQRMVNGKYKLYGRATTVQYGLPTWILFNPSGQFVKFETAILSPWKKQLKELFKDDTNALEAAEKLTNTTNIPLFVISLNKEQAE